MPSDRGDGVAYQFDGPLIDAILSGDKTATIRVDDERDPNPGDTISARHPDGHEFADLEVRAAARVQAIMALHFVKAFNAEHGASDPDDLFDRLSEYYDVGIGPTTPVQVVVFEVIDR